MDTIFLFDLSILYVGTLAHAGGRTGEGGCNAAVVDAAH